MKNNLKKFFAATLLFLAAWSGRAQNHAQTSPGGFSDGDLNSALGISDAWVRLQSSIVPLAMLVVFLGCLIIIAELQHRQNKILSEALRRLAESKPKNRESINE